jgi:hypothetical protein
MGFYGISERLKRFVELFQTGSFPFQKALLTIAETE